LEVINELYQKAISYKYQQNFNCYFFIRRFNVELFKKKNLNILWLIAEDLGPDLECYGTRHVKTPILNRFASEGVLFSNAFTTAPVCSASRSAFMTGMYQTSIDAHHHRSHRGDNYILPEPYSVITEYFRQAGYYTCNCSGLNYEKPGKTDWNFSPKIESFDGTDWRQRKNGQPFFAQINFSEVHRMGIRPDKLSVEPNLVDLPPYYPDHPLTREDWAEYLSTIEVLDEKVGMVLERLKYDGLAENTIVFFFGDHGRNHVRGKQWLYDGGIHIPLIVRWPGKLESGIINENMVSAIDFAPTCLDLAGITPPNHLAGKVFLGSHKTISEYIIAARDRCDETEDRIRCVRTSQYKYIRNYHPEMPYTQYNRYKDAYYPVLRLMHKLYENKQLTPEQALFMAKRKPKEELYDLKEDPHELNNLADIKQHLIILQKFRKILDDWIENTSDRGEFAEDPEVVNQYKQEMKIWAQDRIDKNYKEEDAVLD
jgi:N-sulfoglucosamine sulfohydrolase